MAYSNIAWTIEQALETLLTANIPDATVKSVKRFPSSVESADFLGRFGQGILIKLESMNPVTQSSNTVDRSYVFSLRPYVTYIADDQQSLMNLSEKVFYYLYQNQTNSAWFDLTINPTEYPEPDEDEINTVFSELTIEVSDNVSTS